MPESMSAKEGPEPAPNRDKEAVTTAGHAAYCGFMAARLELSPAMAMAIIPNRPWSALRPDERQAWHIIGLAVVGWWSEQDG